jgi:hypothetical protein
VDYVELEIVNWGKYNPKRDQSSYSWLRLNNDFYLSADLFDLNCEQKMVWITLLCLASKANSGKIKVSASYIAHHLRIKINAVNEAIEIFESKTLATAGGRARPPTTPLRTIRTIRTILLNLAISQIFGKIIRERLAKERHRRFTKN